MGVVAATTYLHVLLYCAYGRFLADVGDERLTTARLTGNHTHILVQFGK